MQRRELVGGCLGALLLPLGGLAAVLQVDALLKEEKYLKRYGCKCFGRIYKMIVYRNRMTETVEDIRTGTRLFTRNHLKVWTADGISKYLGLRAMSDYLIALGGKPIPSDTKLMSLIRRYGDYTVLLGASPEDLTVIEQGRIGSDPYFVKAIQRTRDVYARTGYLG